MLIKSIMIPKNKLVLLQPTDTVELALRIINVNGFLSLPVVDSQGVYMGFVTREDIYDKYIKSREKNFKNFLQSTIDDFVQRALDPVSENIFIEEAADLFFKNDVRFLPINDIHGKLMGILSQKSLFSVITNVYGLEDPKIIIHSSDFIGSLSKILEIIFKHGANVTNIAQFDTEVMGIVEVTIRVTGKNLPKLVDKLRDKGIKVHQFIPAKK